MTIKSIIEQFDTTPFLFIGSGLSRRYLNLPDWKGLLKYFAERISDNEFVYESYENKAKALQCKAGVMPKIAELPDSLVINEEDYLEFQEKSAYLAAKLMTIFMEYPIIFLGYSINDSNIRNIIKSIVVCLDTAQLQRLENRFVFVEYDPTVKTEEVAPYTILIEDKALSMKKIRLKDFLPLYNAIANKKAKLPVRILRRFRQELYEYTITNTPTENLRVASIDDSRVGDEELVLAIGKASEFGLKGLSGLDGNEWYRNIILDDLKFTADELLKYAFPKLTSQNSGRLYNGLIN